MTEAQPAVEIRGPGLDSARLVEEIKASVEEKMRNGGYADPRIARAERFNLQYLKNEEQFLTFYLDCLRGSVNVDISDFDIVERRSRFTRVLVGLKMAIWKLLKFYTYRLWSQQNVVNGLLLSAVEGIEGRNRDRIRELEDRIARLERELKGKA